MNYSYIRYQFSQERGLGNQFSAFASSSSPFRAPWYTHTMADRIAQIAGQLNYPKGLLFGQVAIVTGAAQGIGAEIARLFANEGANVVISDLDAAKSSEVADKINAGRGGKALAVPGDLLKDEYIKELVKKAAEFGQGKIHIIVNNAGFTWDGVIHKVSQSVSLNTTRTPELPAYFVHATSHIFGSDYYSSCR